MIKKLFPFILTTGLLAAPSGLYIEGSVGATSTADTDYFSDAGYSGTLAVGYQLDKFRFELEATESLNEVNGYGDTIKYDASGDIQTTDKFINIYYSGYNKTKFTSSIGLGVGVSDIKFKDISVVSNPEDDKELSDLLSYQASYAIGYMITPSLSYVFKYRYIYKKNEDYDIDKSDNFKTQVLSFGLRYLF
jgi:hypothetical protein